ncbi:MAG: 2-oxoglutarate and iron-dependent oxygenase domain-containing protein [Acidimicrobiales bacterium]
MLDAYSTVGFAYLINHGIPDELVDGVFEASARFHALPRDAKMAIELDRNHRGFIPINSSTDINSSVDTVTTPNQSESFMMMRDDAPDSTAVKRGDYLAGPNQWPAGVPGFREAVDAYNDAMTNLGRHLVDLLAAGLGDTAGELHKAFLTPTTWLRLLYYPPQPAGRATISSDRRHIETSGSSRCWPKTMWGASRFMRPEGSGSMYHLSMGPL